MLKEIALTNEFDNIKDLPDYIREIMIILKNGKINYNKNSEGILKMLEKRKGGNILNYSHYTDEIISQFDIDNKIISKLSYNTKKDIIYIKNCLGLYTEYMKIFEKEFERAKRESVFEYSIISLVIIEREVANFEENRKLCNNRVDRVLFHGTSHDSISKILPDEFRVGKGKCFQHGRGVYFTEDLDSCWIYGSDSNKNVNQNNRNLNIPKVNEYLSFIASTIYYNKQGFRRVYDSNYSPKKYEINFAYAGMERLETIKEELPDKSKFIGTEFVINDMNQICPFLSCKLKRDEYCIIWRDTNFSPNPVYNNKFDKIFKEYLKERMTYINQIAKFNIYPCETSNEALNLIKRKKYNKIILISNIGNDLGGKTFINNAREIIGNDIIVLFLAYRTEHLNWVTKYKNALFSNSSNFYEKYLDCFYDKNEYECQQSLLNLKTNLEKFYNVKFNFDNKFLYYPYYYNNNIKKFSDLTFN